MKRILAVVLILACSTIFSSVAFAATSLFDVCTNSNSDTTSQSAACASKYDTNNPISGSNSIIVKITNFIALIAGLAAVILLIIAGIKYITSQGDTAGVKAAKASLINVLIGILVIVLGRQLIVYVVSRL